MAGNPCGGARAQIDCSPCRVLCITDAAPRVCAAHFFLVLGPVRRHLAGEMSRCDGIYINIFGRQVCTEMAGQVMHRGFAGGIGIVIHMRMGNAVHGAVALHNVRTVVWNAGAHASGFGSLSCCSTPVGAGRPSTPCTLSLPKYGIRSVKLSLSDHYHRRRCHNR